MATQGLQYNDLVKAQQGMTRDQIADKANQIVPIQPVQNTAIPADQLGTGTAIKLPQPNPDTTAADGVVGGATQATKGIQDYLKEITPPETETSKSYNDLLGQINTLLPNLANKGQDQLQQEKNVGLPDLKKNLAALNAQILSRTAEYEKAYTGEELRVAPIGNIVGRQAALRRNQASEIGLLQARALGLQGQVEMAQETANRAIDLKYDTMEDTINVKMQQLQLIQPILDKEERRYATALERKYTDEREALAEKKAKAKENISLAFSANVKSTFANKGGEFFRVSDGKPYGSAEEFFKDAGVTSFEDAYRRGVVTDITASRLADIEFAAQARANYIDANINITDSPDVVRQKVMGSAIFREQTRPPQYASGSGPGTLEGTPIIDSSIDNQVKSIIASRSGDGGYGDAYNAVKAKFGEAVANKYDKVYQSVFNKGSSIDAAFNDAKLGSTPSSGIVDASGKPIELTAAQKGTISDWSTLMGQINEALTIGEKTGFAGVGGLVGGSTRQFLFKEFSVGSIEEQNLRNAIGNVRATLAKARGGTSFTANEEKLLNTYTPGINESADSLRSKLNSLLNFASESIKNTYKVSGAVNTDQKIRVRRKADGVEGEIPAFEFDPNLYEYL